ncbi:Serine/threonine-protein kinase PknB [Sporomusa ovata DSM 2662]|uniref:Serine/threonine protein kinase PrkC, regulator of stationary phase n=1 Tax=Sporomusa ovata TaxID=2378 RepID=A0A0U1KTC3_9FIRM|nr:AAA family ATPase [Sporomusa ovata]EQB26589.1 serine/threonine-protein kinase [Sporomusa ovata DSM 2662]CQR70678.1 Serine/threonine protein kinase PrkC, regulator of stationary phase [Sporomusa ovata]
MELSKILSLPDYIITEEICEYDCFKVCRAQKVQSHMPVIIKTLKTGASQIDIAKLINEYEITRNLDITGIIKPVRLEWAGLAVVLILEDFAAIPIRKHLLGNDRELPLFFSIAIQLTETLGELHQKGVIHRNLKPDAILIHPDTKQVIIADFSIATIMSRKGHPELPSHTFSGTPAYMSPEQFGRMSTAIDHRSDLYSLGVVLYEMLSGRLPLHADNDVQWVHAHMAKKPVDPGKINPGIPLAVTAIIMKLLAKTATERYQSAAGLLADLEECRRQWSQSNKIEPFTPGQRDFAGSFQLPHKLYGREKEVAALTAAFERACSGQSGLMLVYGYAGTGKTVLIQETLRLPATKKGYFITGKSDQLQRNNPYAPFIQAFGNLLRQILTESQERLAVWKRTLNRALGKNGAIITEVIPEVELIAGPQPAAERLQPREAQNRFRLIFRNFVRAFAQKAHPLVIFLDDLQWADPASLELVQCLSAAADIRYLLLLGAYRDNEVTGTHRLLTAIQELQIADILVQQVPLTSLAPTHTGQFIADTLHCEPEKSAPLAEIMHRKTGGNPFFLGQLLQSAYEENLLVFNLKDGCWEWETSAIQDMSLTDDVIDFMLGKLQKLPAATRNVLQLAACIGNIFDLQTLAIACEQTPGQTAAALRLAIAEGLILPLNAPGQTQEPLYRLDDDLSLVDFAAKYEFLHDRVQQAAYSLIPAEGKKEAHVKIGRLFLQSMDRDELKEKIYDIMDHLNRGLDLIHDQTEKIKLAGYNLLAGKKAKAAIAYAAALNYFKTGIDLLPGDAWQDYYQVTYDLYLERFQCEHLCAHFDIAEVLFDLILSKAKTNLEKANLYEIKIILNLGIEKYQETLQLGIKGLNLLGVNLPESPGKFALLKELLSAKWHLQSHKLGDFAKLPEITDPVQNEVMRLLFTQALVASIVNPELYTFILLKINNLSRKFGNTYCFMLSSMCYIFCAGRVLGDYKTMLEYKKDVQQQFEQYTSSFDKYLLNHSIGTYISHWTEHVQTGIDYLQKAVDHALEGGKLLFAGYAMTLLIENKYFSGASLAELYQECQHYYHFSKLVRLLYYQTLIANLRGLTGENAMFGNENCAEDTCRELKDHKKAVMARAFAKIQLSYLYGDYGNALATAEQAQQNINAVKGFLLSAEYSFYYCLAITARFDGLPVKQQQKYRKILKKHRDLLQKWSDSCPANFLHKYLLVAAETARLDNKDSAAMALYDQSIQSAREHGYIQNEAIAGELSARFHLAKGRDKIAQVYLTDACHRYLKWGATRKVRYLKEQYPHLLGGTSPQEEMLKTAEILKNACRFTGVGVSGFASDPDLCTIRKAVQKLAEGTDPPALLKSLLEMACENAGADKGYLILGKSENLLSETAMSGKPYPAITLISHPVGKRVNFSRTTVRYVARMLEPVVLNDTEQAGIFAGDPYLAGPCPQSIICLPLLCQGLFVGVLYLENTLMCQVFTPDRLEMVRLLASQMAYIQKLQLSVTEDAAAVTEETPLLLADFLTERELDVLRLIAAGMSNREIAQELQLTVNTVKTHILNVYGKLQVNRRVQAIARARELKLLTKE